MTTPQTPPELLPLQSATPRSGKVWSVGLGLVGVLLFLGLMIFAMQRNANFVPSQLVGREAPNFVAQTAQGGDLNLDQLKSEGRWIVLNFWSTTCFVCREEAPELERFWRDVVQKSPKAPAFVSVNMQDTREDILNWQRDYKQSFPVVMDVVPGSKGSGCSICLDYGITGTPETFFVDPSGKVRHRVAGEVTSDSILRFIDWLEKNPGANAESAQEGFLNSYKGG